MDYKFNEDKLISEFTEYVNSTYKLHYGQTEFQANEVIIDRGNGLGFMLGNVDKYLDRFGKKGDSSDHRKDLFKILHYTLLALHVHDKENSTK
jgi:hypothetical protein